MSARPALRLLRGGRATRWNGNGLEVVAAAPDAPPFAVAREVVEEDTWRVLGADPEWRPAPDEHPVRLHTALVFDSPAPLGGLLRHGRRWHAVVVDLDATPLVGSGHVAAALARVAQCCREEGVRTLALPPLGAVHGDLVPGHALALLREALLQTPPPSLERVWLVTPLQLADAVERTLAGWPDA